MFFDRLPEKGYVCAHRGARALFPENTILGAELCLGLGADFWEMDVQKSADGTLVVFHDDVLTRTTNVEQLTDFADRAPWVTTDFTFSEMQQLDCGQWFHSADPFGTVAADDIPDELFEMMPGQKIPSLKEALDFTVSNNFPMNIEIKDQIHSPGDLSIVDLILQEIHAADAQSFVLVSSFNHDYLARVKYLAPHIPTAVLAEEQHPDNILDYLKKFNAAGYHPDAEITDIEMIRTLAREGVHVTPFTVNDMDQAISFIRNGCFGITTDYTHTLRDKLGKEAR